MLHYDRLVIRIEPGAAPERYEVFIEGEGGEGHGHFDLPFRALDIENFVLRMSRGRGTRRAGTSEANRAKAFGHELFTALFQGEVRDVYRSCVADARRQNRGLRVTLALTKVPELMDVPWEYLYDEPDFLAVSAWTPVVRYLDVARPKAPLPVTPPLRVLGMISDVVDMPWLERQLIYNGHPLYTLTADTRPGQIRGQGFLGAWYVVSPAGHQVGGHRGSLPADY